MLSTWVAIFVALAYVGLLFAIASYGDRVARRHRHGAPRPFIYALSLGVYCTSWTYFGSVGLASRSGLDFLPIYIGPILMLVLGWPLLRAVVTISKQQNITSIADFIAARYGKNQLLGALVAIVAVIGVVPYIALQLKAVSFSLETMLPAGAVSAGLPGPAQDLALLVTIAMAGFAALFGTRHIDATEHQDGMILAIAVESVVKLLAFLAVGVFVTFWLMGGPGDLLNQVAERADITQLFAKGFDGGRWLTMTILATFAILLLPRQFHVAVVENSNLNDVRRAAWLFPLYLVAINLFVVPIAIAGLLTFGDNQVDGDTYVLALPFDSGYRGMTLVAFVGGLSAATAMVIIETVALSIMVCNNLVMPVLLSLRSESGILSGDVGRTLIAIRRLAIVVILILAYSYYRMIASSAALAQTGLLSFAAVAQFAPAFFIGLMWRRATAKGAMAGLIAGFALWGYTLLLPSFADAGWIPVEFVTGGPFGIGLLRPRMLFNLEFDPLAHGVLWSLAVNTAVYFAVSLLTPLSGDERAQANAFVPVDRTGAAPSFRMWRSTVSVDDVTGTVARYLGAERTRRSFEEFASQSSGTLDPGAEAEPRLIRFAEHLLASAVGAASSRLVMALLLERHSGSSRGQIRLLDDATAAIQYNRDLLQSAIDHVRQGIAVFDSSLNLVCWNRQFRTLLSLPAELGRVGVAMPDILSAIARNNGTNPTILDQAVLRRIYQLNDRLEPYQERMRTSGSVVEVRPARMPDGGLVVTFADITERVATAEALEKRVQERTAALTELNRELETARAEAEAANIGKTRFIAAASHDILQPLNAARLFTSTLVERQGNAGGGELVHNLDASLVAVEEILNTLLDISRLDAGAMRTEVNAFAIDDILNALAMECMPAARERGVTFKAVGCGLTVRTDRRMLRRVVQNLLANAIKYADGGRVLLGCRRRAGALIIEVHDTGPGIPADKIETIFIEFERLGRTAGREAGLGLGLSIVERICRMLELDLHVASGQGKGSVFSVSVPLAIVAAAPATASRAKPRARAGAVALPAANQTVLVVDNEPAIRTGMRALLSDWGFSVITACTSSAALDIETPIDVILADYHLDDGDGLDLIAALRCRSGQRLPAVLITADRSVRVREQARAAGVVFLSKPIKPAALRAAVNQMASSTKAAE